MLDRSNNETPENPQAAHLRQVVAQGRWAIATDGVQWILQRHRGDRWENLSFVRTTRDILARCMREKGAQPDEMGLLAGLPDRFQEAPQTDKNTCGVRSADKTAPPTRVTS